jgi:hypothetical protein
MNTYTMIHCFYIAWVCNIHSLIHSFVHSFFWFDTYTVLGRPGRGASQVEISPHLNWDTQFLTVAYNGACSPNSMNLLQRIALQEKNNLMSSRLNIVEIARVA